jgi:hypothetical protein
LQANYRFAAWQVAPLFDTIASRSSLGGIMNIVAERQKGITLLGFIIILVVGGVFAYMALQLFGPFMELFRISKALNSTANEINATNMSEQDLYNQFDKRIYIDYITDFDRRAFKLETKPQRQLHVSYERRVPFFYNIDFIVKIDKISPIKDKTGGT